MKTPVLKNLKPIVSLLLIVTIASVVYVMYEKGCHKWFQKGLDMRDKKTTEAYNNGFTDGVNELTSKKLHNSIGNYFKIDYPLIDIYFDNGSKWIVYYKCSANEDAHVLENPQDIEDTKQDLIVTTFPSGHGTTADGELFVYEDGKLIKCVEYMDAVMIKNEKLRSQFKRVSMAELRSLLEQRN